MHMFVFHCLLRSEGDIARHAKMTFHIQGPEAIDFPVSINKFIWAQWVTKTKRKMCKPI